MNGWSRLTEREGGQEERGGARLEPEGGILGAVGGFDGDADEIRSTLPTGAFI